MPQSLEAAPAVWSAEDRSLRVEPGHVVKTGWVRIADCLLANRTRMAIGDVEAKYRVLLCQGDAALWPPITGTWQGDRFAVSDGRHQFVASLMLGHEKVLVAWIALEELLGDA